MLICSSLEQCVRLPACSLCWRMLVSKLEIGYVLLLKQPLNKDINFLFLDHHSRRIGAYIHIVILHLFSSLRYVLCELLRTSQYVLDHPNSYDTARLLALHSFSYNFSRTSKVTLFLYIPFHHL